MLDTKFYLDKICKKYNTRNVYQIVDDAGIIVHHMNLGKNTRGMCYTKRRIKQIFLHDKLEEWEERFVISHELGHLIMHPEHNAPFLQTTFFSRNRYEIEANKFAVELIIPDDVIMEHCEYTIEQWSSIYGLPIEIIELRFK